MPDNSVYMPDARFATDVKPNGQVGWIARLMSVSGRGAGCPFTLAIGCWMTAEPSSCWRKHGCAGPELPPKCVDQWRAIVVPDGHGDTSKAALLTEGERAKSVVISDPSRPDTPIIYVSDEFQAQTGYPPEEVLGRNCRFLQGPETDPQAVQAIRDALAAETEITIDIINYRKDGSEFWNRLRIRPLFDDKGELLYFAGAQNPIPADEARPYPIEAVFD